MKHNEGLQVLRGLCCLGILFAHSFAYAEWTWNLNFGAFPGRSGMLDYVAFFFFLTGYLVAAQINSLSES